MSRYLNPKSDLVFKKIFNEHPHLLKSFLNALLPLPADGWIESLSYLPAEQTPIIPVLKNTVVDVKCTDQQGRTFIVEMQISWTDSFKQRLLFSSSQAYVKQLEKGEDYHLLQPVYGLGLIGSIFDKTNPEWYHHYRLVNVEKPYHEVIEGLQLVFIELPKFKPTTKEGRKLRILWLRFMEEIDEKTLEPSADLLNVPEIREAIDLAREAAYTKGELEAYESFWKQVSSEKALLRGSFEEGEARGIEKQAQETVRRMYEKGMDIATISECTGLSEADIIRLRDNH